MGEKALIARISAPIYASRAKSSDLRGQQIDWQRQAVKEAAELCSLVDDLHGDDGFRGEA